MPPWADEFPNDNPDLFTASEYPPALPDEDLDFEVVDAFEESDFAHAVTESILPEPPPAAESHVDGVAVAEEARPEEEAYHETEEEEHPATEDAPAQEQVAEAREASAWQTYVAVMGDVAMAFGATHDVARGLALTLEADAVARAWRVAIEGGEADFTACGSAMLDEYSAGLLAQLTGAAMEPIRRELRSRGVCAFGLIAA
jgi:hypothetical protein